MTIQVNIGEAKTRLSELVAASERGETVLLARAGKAVAHIGPPPSITTRAETPAEAAARRRATLKRNGELYRASGITLPDDAGLEPSMTEAELEERWQRKFGSAR